MRWKFLLLPAKNIPKDWFPLDWKSTKVLGLASGGGQQIPILAATGANVTVFDLSEEQIKRDLEVCEEEGLSIKTIIGDMSSLDNISSEEFDLIINPVSNCFVQNVLQVWIECFRVLKPGGSLISGFNNPVAYALDTKAHENGDLKLVNSIPFSDLNDLSEEDKKERIEQGNALEFGHSLTELIGGQIDAGFQIAGFYEDYWGEDFNQPLDKILPQFIATRSIKPS